MDGNVQLMMLEVIFTCVNEANVSDKSLDEAIDAIFKGRMFHGLEDLSYDVRCFFSCPHDRMKYTSVVDNRCEDMIIQGLTQETTDLSLSNALPDEGQPNTFVNKSAGFLVPGIHATDKTPAATVSRTM